MEDASHQAGFDLIGGWPVLDRVLGWVKIANATPYPCHLEEGTIAGVLAGFPAQRDTYEMRDTPRPKRRGGTETHYEVHFIAKR